MTLDEIKSQAKHYYDTPEEELKAVTDNGIRLHVIHRQTPEICLAAVQQDHRALKFVNPDIFSIAAACDGKVVGVEGAKYQLPSWLPTFYTSSGPHYGWQGIFE